MKSPIRSPKVAPPKPTFLIIGSAKCGTTTLATVLDRHPDCCFSRPKEVDFFQEIAWKEPFAGKPNPNYARGWDWYRQAWTHYNGEPVMGEASPAYSDRQNSPQTAARVHNLNPGMKLIFMVRHPLEKALSAWAMRYFDCHPAVKGSCNRNEPALRGFSKWLVHQQAEGQWNDVRYDYQIDAYREYFPENQILISFLEDWKHKAKNEVERILKFLYLDPQRIHLNGELAVNRAEDRRVEAKWARALRVTKMTTRLSPFVPKSVKPLLLDKLILRKFPMPEPEINPRLADKFRAYVVEDNARFLARYGKPANFWDASWNHCD